MPLLEDLHIWQLRNKMNHLQQIWPALNRASPQLRDHHNLLLAMMIDATLLDQRLTSWLNRRQIRDLGLHFNNPSWLPLRADSPLYIVHLFSGRRRAGDFHFHMQKFLQISSRFIH